VHKVYSQSPWSLAIIIPKEHAKALGIKAGTKLQIDVEGDAIIMQKLTLKKGRSTQQ